MNTLEQELAEFVAHSEYEVRFEHAVTHDWFYVRVFFDGKLIDEKAVCKSYPRAARWAKRRVSQHQHAMAHLGPLAPPKAQA